MKSDREGLPPLFEEHRTEERPLLVWFVVITLAVFSGNLLSNYASAKIVEWQLAKAVAEAQVKINHQSARLNAEAEAARERRAIADAERARIQSAESDRRTSADAQRRNALRIATETCSFWTTAWREEQITYNKRMMDESCALVNSLR
jgi:hypothetical protein